MKFIVLEICKGVPHGVPQQGKNGKDGEIGHNGQKLHSLGFIIEINKASKDQQYSCPTISCGDEARCGQGSGPDRAHLWEA